MDQHDVTYGFEHGVMSADDVESQQSQREEAMWTPSTIVHPSLAANNDDDGSAYASLRRQWYALIDDVTARGWTSDVGPPLEGKSRSVWR